MGHALGWKLQLLVCWGLRHLESHISVDFDIGAEDDLKLDFRMKPSPCHAAHLDSHFWGCSFGCLINSDCFNPGIFLLVKRRKIKYKS